MEKELDEKLDKLATELEEVEQLWDDLNNKFEQTVFEIAKTLKSVIKIRTEYIIMEFENRLVDMFCISPETCKIEGEFICSECKRHDVVIKKIKDKFGGENGKK